MAILQIIEKSTEERDYFIQKEKASAAQSEFYSRLKTDKGLRDFHLALQSFISSQVSIRNT